MISTGPPRGCWPAHVYGGGSKTAADVSTRRVQTNAKCRVRVQTFSLRQLETAGNFRRDVLPLPFPRRRLSPLMTQPHTRTGESVEIPDATRQRAQQRRAFAEAISHIHDQHDGLPAGPLAEPIVPEQGSTHPRRHLGESRNVSF